VIESAEPILTEATNRLPKLADGVLAVRKMLVRNTVEERKRVMALLIETIRVTWTTVTRRFGLSSCADTVSR